ncbi:unnamed protein product [Mytilus coruscus]|uniref:Death domain-containing protein n=1 Tax=Mytilus coruscus TaxID=42192 RepID=A0A6J7ZXY4_MYTCO|nr:unnamed protein product [Mytilus coruscus]
MLKLTIVLGLVADELKQCPTDQQIGRLVFGLNLEVVKELFHHLAMPTHKWNGLQSNYHWYGNLKFFALWEWKQKAKEATFSAIQHALMHVKEDPHILCEVSLPEEVLASPPDEFLLENLSNNIGNDNLLLGLELGFEGVELQDIVYQHKTRLIDQTREILKRWSRLLQPSSVLAKAFNRIDKFGVFTRCIQI